MNLTVGKLRENSLQTNNRLFFNKKNGELFYLAISCTCTCKTLDVRIVELFFHCKSKLKNKNFMEILW